MDERIYFSAGFFSALESGGIRTRDLTGDKLGFSVSAGIEEYLHQRNIRALSIPTSAVNNYIYKALAHVLDSSYTVHEEVVTAVCKITHRTAKLKVYTVDTQQTTTWVMHVMARADEDFSVKWLMRRRSNDRLDTEG